MNEIYKVTKADLIGEIERFPIEVVQLMVERQFEHIGYCNVSVFQHNRSAGGSGFVWVNTPEGRDFWDCVINECDFDRFFDLYPSAGYKSTAKKAKPIKTKHISWTRQQKWVLERLSHIEGSFEERLGAFDKAYYSGHLSESVIGVPPLAEDIDEALNLFGRRVSPEMGASEKIRIIAYMMLRESRNIKRIYESFFRRGHLDSLEMHVGLKDGVAKLKPCAMNWIKHNPWVGSRTCSRIYFCDDDNCVSFVPLRHTKLIPSGFKKNRYGFYQLNNAVLIGDYIYIFQ